MSKEVGAGGRFDIFLDSVLYCHLSRDKPQTKNQRKIKLIGKLYLSTRGVSIKKKIAQGTFIKVSEINPGNV